jgi:hypothetical protein
MQKPLEDLAPPLEYAVVGSEALSVSYPTAAGATVIVGGGGGRLSRSREEAEWTVGE